MKNMNFFLLLSLGFSMAWAEERVIEQPTSRAVGVVGAVEVVENESAEDLSDKEADKIALISEAFGHIIAKHIESIGIDFDIPRLAKGLQDATEGKTPPMSDAECIAAITEARQKNFENLAAANLEKANEFMQEIKENPEVKTLEEGKLHYRIEQEGVGVSILEGNTPLIRYTGKFIDGSIFGASKEDDLIMLDETIPGFGRGLIGMKEGEKRTLYIHPELGYGTKGQLPPNSLLVFEIELIKANAESEAKESTTPVVESSHPTQETASLETAQAPESTVK